MKSTFTILVFLYSILSYAQSFNFFTLVDKPCFGDTGNVIMSSPNTIVYQTKDGTPFGEIDSTKCFPISKEGTFMRWIDISAMDEEMPLFVRSDVHEHFEDFPLTENTLYYITGALIGDKILYQDPENCTEPLCTKLIVGTTIPVEDGSDVVKRYVEIQSDSYNSFESCLPTQKFDSLQYIHELTMQIMVSDSAKTLGKIRVPYASINELGWQNLVENIAPVRQQFQTTDSTYLLSFMDFFDDYGPIFLVTHNLEGYPSSQNMAIYEVEPEIYHPAPVTITVNDMYGETGLHFQEYTMIRGALVEGSEPLRHNVIFDIDQSVCLFIFELVIGSGGTIRFREGSSIDMYGAQACLQLRNDAKMVIAEGHHLVYGSNGKGNLAMRENASIHLEPGSSLTFDGCIIPYGFDEIDENDRASIYVPKNSHLSFTKDASIDLYLQGKMKIDIYMQGGTIDYSQLPPDQVEKLNIIYPQQPLTTFDLAPNLTSEYLHLSLGQDSKGSYKIIDSRGIKVLSGDLYPYLNHINVSTLSRGIYYLQYRTTEESKVAKFVKI